VSRCVSGRGEVRCSALAVRQLLALRDLLTARHNTPPTPTNATTVTGVNPLGLARVDRFSLPWAHERFEAAQGGETGADQSMLSPLVPENPAPAPEPASPGLSPAPSPVADTSSWAGRLAGMPNTGQGRSPEPREMAGGGKGGVEAEGEEGAMVPILVPVPVVVVPVKKPEARPGQSQGWGWALSSPSPSAATATPPTPPPAPAPAPTAAPIR
jgi:hypothetical protein